jgi:hypothetical protein
MKVVGDKKTQTRRVELTIKCRALGWMPRSPETEATAKRHLRQLAREISKAMRNVSVADLSTRIRTLPAKDKRSTIRVVTLIVATATWGPSEVVLSRQLLHLANRQLEKLHLEGFDIELHVTPHDPHSK